MGEQEWDPNVDQQSDVGDVVSKSLSGHEHLAHCPTRRSSDSPTTGIRVVVRLDGGAGVRS